jgi:hypothetical protein
MRFSSVLGYFGLVGGLAIALGFPWMILRHGSELDGRAQVFLIFSALVVGAILAIASAVIGITIPTAIRNGKLDLNRYVNGACGRPVGRAVHGAQEAADRREPDEGTGRHGSDVSPRG